MPSAFSVANSPVTSSGILTVIGAGTALQYIDGTGALQTFPPPGSGPQGATGVTGFQGSTGAQGVTGFQGSTGVTGFQGGYGCNWFSRCYWCYR